jgi:hypothetical protein
MDALYARLLSGDLKEEDLCAALIEDNNRPADFGIKLRSLEDGYGKEMLSMAIAMFGVQIIDVLSKILPADYLDELTLASYPPAPDNSAHPLYACVEQGIDAKGMFALIQKFYHRRFSLLYELETYCETNNLLVGYAEKEGINAVARLLKKYNVQPEEFDYAELDSADGKSEETSEDS